MGSTIKAKPFKLGPFQLSLGQLVGGGPTEFTLDKLPFRNGDIPGGVGMLERVVLYIQATVGTLASDPAVDAYRLHRLVDWQLEAQDGNIIVNRKGWHDPVREYMQFGRFIGQVCADLPVTGGGGPGTYTRTFTKTMSFVEPRMKDRYFRLLPSALFRNGKLRVTCYNTAQAVGGASPKLNDVIVTAYFYIKDWPAGRMPIGSLVQETYTGVDPTQPPSPGAGHYLRCAAVLDPATASFADDLSGVTVFDFGALDDAGQIHRKRDVSEHIREWNDSLSGDMKSIIGTLTSPQEYYRFLDPTSNKTGKLHAIPLVYPHKGDGLDRMPYWNSRPPLNLNNDNYTGLPQPSFIYDLVKERDEDSIRRVIDQVKAGASRRFMSMAKGAAAAGYGKYPFPKKAPVVADIR